MPARFQFTVAATDGRARIVTIAMRRGTIRTFAIVPVGTTSLRLLESAAGEDGSIAPSRATPPPSSSQATASA